MAEIYQIVNLMKRREFLPLLLAMHPELIPGYAQSVEKSTWCRVRLRVKRYQTLLASATAAYEVEEEEEEPEPELQQVVAPSVPAPQVVGHLSRAARRGKRH